MVTVGIGETYGPEKESDRIYQKYYQWVVFILVLLAVMLHIPAFLWKVWEGGRMKNICQDFGSPIISPNWNGVESIRIVKYLRQKGHRTLHRYYAYRFIFCEILNFLMVIFVFWLLDLIFSGFWMEYGKAARAIFHMDTPEWTISTARLFPKLAKCSFRRFGSSGTVESRDALCLLSLNIINEKIFAILWVWMPFLFLVTTLNIIYKMVLFSCAPFRMKILQSQVCGEKISTIRFVTYDGDFGQWFILYQMSRNINPEIFRQIVRELKEYDREKNRKNLEKDNEEDNETSEVVTI